MESDNMPPELSALAEWLSSLGFHRTDHGDERSFGDRIAEFKHPRLAIQLLRDRANWVVLIGGPSVDGYYDVGIWRAYVSGTNALLSDPQLSLGEEADFVRRHLTQIERAVETDPELDAKLAVLGTQRSHEMFGLS